jgi:hypothetical protein
MPASSNWSKVTPSLIPLEDIIQNIAEAMPFKSTAHCTETSKHIFPEMKLRGLVPNFYIHVYDLYIPTIGPQQYSRGNI